MSYLLEEGVKRVRLWPQGVDARRFHPGKASMEWRERLSGGHPEDRLLLYVGRLAPEKGIERLKTILREVPGTRLAVVGDGPARGNLEREFSDALATFTGVLQGDDLAAAYASADVFLFPSTTDTLGLAMLEAFASGLPVVAARSDPSSEIVLEGENGLLYEAGSRASLGDAVGRLVSDDGFREALSHRARETAEERDWASSTSALRGYYEEALGLPR